MTDGEASTRAATTETAHAEGNGEGEPPLPKSRTRRVSPRPIASVAPSLYGTEFWVAFLANLLLTTANSLTFRFADFVNFLQGTAVDTGWIVGVGTGGSVLVRLWFGRAVDQHGPRWVWMGSGVAFVASCLLLLGLDSVGPLIYVARFGYACGIAGMFSCSVVHICTGVSVERRAELIGTLGTSGFIGMMLGPKLGDWVFLLVEPGRMRYLIIFSGAALLVVVYVWLVAYLTRRSVRPEPHEVPSFGRLLFDHWPGVIVVVAMMMGMALVVPSTFLTRFRDARDLGGIATFFWFYAPTGILMRIVGRRWPEQLGRRKSILVGLACLAASMLLYPTVTTDWQLAWPALLAGTGHALLFPCVTTLGAESFPERHRATAVTLILGFFDLGTMCGAPLLGTAIVRFGFDAMFQIAATLIGFVAVVFAIASLMKWRRDKEMHELASEEALGEW